MSATAIIAIMLTGPALAEDAQLLVRGEWQATPVRDLPESLDPVELCEYGGWRARQVDATGFFRTERIDGRWWLVDPDGHLFISVGLCSVAPEGVDKDPLALQRYFGDIGTWAIRTAKLLQGLGFNSLGCWSDWRPIRASEHPMPYFPRWNFMRTYKNQRDPKWGPPGWPNDCMPLFDPDFESFCDSHAQQLAATKDDPYLVGHFSDNELPFRPNLLDLYLEQDPGDTGYQAARKWLDESRAATGTPAEAEITLAEQDAFLEFASDRYYRIVNEAIKRHDSNHLFVGSRVHGRTIRPATLRGARHADVVSVNYYHRWSPESERLDGWVEAAGRPFLNSEWYAMKLDSKDVETSGAGFRVKTQRDRGLFYRNMVLGLLDHPGCVGWHWFKYGGDNDQTSRGFVSEEFLPHSEMHGVMSKTNKHVYGIAPLGDSQNGP